MVSGFPFTPSTTDLPNAIAFSQLFPATTEYPNGYFFAATSNTASVAGGPGNTVSIYFVDAVTGKFTPAVGSPFSLASIIDPTTGAISQPTRGIGAPTPTSIAIAPLANGKLYGGFIQSFPAPQGNSTSIFSIDLNTGISTLVTPSATFGNENASGNSGLTFSAPVSLASAEALYQTVSEFDTSLIFASVSPTSPISHLGRPIYLGVIDALTNIATTNFSTVDPLGTIALTVSFAPPLNNQLFFAGATTSATQPGSVSIYSLDLVSHAVTPVPCSPFTLTGITHLSSVSVLPLVNGNTFYLAAVNVDSATTSTIYLYSFDTATNKLVLIGSPVSAGAAGTVTFSPPGTCPFIAAMQNPNALPLTGTINTFSVNLLTPTLSPLEGSPFDSGGTAPGPVAFSSLLPNNTLFAATVNHNTAGIPTIALFKTTASSSVSLAVSPTTLAKGQSGTLTATLTGNGPFTVKISASTTPSTLTTSLFSESPNGGPSTVLPLTPNVAPTTEMLTITGPGPTIEMTITPNVTTQYQVISYTDGSGCTTCGPSDPITVPVDPITNVKLVSPSSCKLGGTNFSATITGGVPPYTILPYLVIAQPGEFEVFPFSPLVSNTNIFSTTINYQPALVGATGNVNFLRVTDATGNQVNSNFVEHSNFSTLIVSIMPSSVSVAQGQSFTLTADVSQNGAFTPTFSWKGPNGFTSTARSITVNNAQSANGGTYMVTASIAHTFPPDFPLQHMQSCTGSASAEVTVTGASSGTITATSQRVCIGQSFSLTANIPGATSYAWTGPDGFTASTQTITITNAQVANGGTYSVTATVGDSKVTASIVIDVGLFPNIVTGYQSALSKAIQAKYCS